MMLASELIAEVSRDLNDNEPGFEYTRWPQAVLLEYLHDAITQMAFIKPESAAHNIIYKLSPGNVQELPDGCHTILDIPRNMGKDGVTPSLDTTPSKSDYPTLRSVRRKPCPSKNGYQVINYAQGKEDRTRFVVYPPVPSSLPLIDAYVEITCSGIEAPLLISDPIPVNSVYHNAIREFMLYRAYSLDTESQTSIKHAESHKAEFYNSLKIRFIQEGAREKEEAQN